MGLPAAQSYASGGSGSVTKYLISSPLETPQELPGEIEMFLDPEKSSLTQCHCPGDRLSRCREPVRERELAGEHAKGKVKHTRHPNTASAPAATICLCFSKKKSERTNKRQCLPSRLGEECCLLPATHSLHFLSDGLPRGEGIAQGPAFQIPVDAPHPLLGECCGPQPASVPVCSGLTPGCIA